MATRNKIDDSRSRAALGEDVVQKVSKLRVLIAGLNGIGVEIAKNLVMAGPKQVALFDPRPVAIADLGRNFFLKEHHVGAAGVTHASASVEPLSELNAAVSVGVIGASGALVEHRDGAATEAAATELSEAILSRFDVAVFTDTPRSELLRWNAFCRSKNIAFIASDVRGVAGFCFVDFAYTVEEITTRRIEDAGGRGKNTFVERKVLEKSGFTILDHNGEAAKTAHVTLVTQSNPAKVNTLAEKRHGLEDGDWVVFRELEGMVELNDGKPRRVKNCRAFDFELEEDTTGFGAHTLNGIVTQVKMPKIVGYASLAERIKTPLPADDPMGMLITPDFGKFGRSEQLHIAFAAVEDFRAAHNCLPEIRNPAHAAEVVALAKAWLAANPQPSVDAVDEKFVFEFALIAASELPALCAFYGGIAAQEIVKLSGKFTPLRQWLYMDMNEVLPADHDKMPAAEFVQAGTRYDNTIAIFGKTNQEKIMNQRVFVVGSGALGCEHLKSFVLMGVGCGPTGKVTITDMDHIEASNLNRQFLFRNHDIGKPKSVTAAAAARSMNKDMNIVPMEIAVGIATEGTFNDTFWDNIDVVVNALDNVNARKYVDATCIWYRKPLLESGTLGVKCNTQTIIPYKTECYGDSEDPPEDSIPMCTVKNFPFQIEHTIEWAREGFAGFFTTHVQEAANFLADPAKWLADNAKLPKPVTRRAALQGVKDVLTNASSANFASCVRVAREMYNDLFNLRIRHLIHYFPEDYKDKETGEKFWGGTKRFPTPAEFSLRDPATLQFMVHTTCLLAECFGVKVPEEMNQQYEEGAHDPRVDLLEPIVKTIAVAPFVPTTGHRIKVKDTDGTEEGADDDDAAIARLMAELTSFTAGAAGGAAGGAGATAGGSASLHLSPAEFDKDNDANHHVAWMTAASNLRARSYRIQEATFLQVRVIAGRIIPALATTTCTVTGLVAAELYKVVLGIFAPRNAFLSLGTNMYAIAEPAGPKRQKSGLDETGDEVRCVPEGFTHWDRIDVKGNLTFRQFIDWLKANHHGFDCTMVSCVDATGPKVLYNPVLFSSHKERIDKPILDFYIEKAGAPTKPYIKLYLDGFSADDVSAKVPPVALYYTA